MKKRIWELDFARGAALLGMMIIRFIRCRKYTKPS